LEEEADEEETINRDTEVRNKIFANIGIFVSNLYRASLTNEVPNISCREELNNLRNGDDRAESLRKTESVVVIHQSVNETIEKHTILLGTRVVCNNEEKEKCSCMVIDVKETNGLKCLTTPDHDCSVKPFPNLGKSESD